MMATAKQLIPIEDFDSPKRSRASHQFAVSQRQNIAGQSEKGRSFLAAKLEVDTALKFSSSVTSGRLWPLRGASRVPEKTQKISSSRAFKRRLCTYTGSKGN